MTARAGLVVSWGQRWTRHAGPVVLGIVVTVLAISACGSEPGRVFVAMGDSYASGEGLSPYDHGTDALAGSGANRCHRSASAYPRLVAAARKIRMEHVACSGAKLADLAGSSSSSVPAQIEAVAGNVELVTITIGANDLDAVDTLVRCVVASLPCGLTTETIEAGAAQVEGRLAAAIIEIHRRAAKARVIVVGYPQIVPAELPDACAGLGPARLPGQADAAAWFHDETTHVNAALERAAAESGAGFVDSATAFVGHDVCAADNWVNGIVVPLSASFHPTAEGQRVLAGLVTRALEAP